MRIGAGLKVYLYTLIFYGNPEGPVWQDWQCQQVKGGESRIFLAIKGYPDLPQFTGHLKQSKVIMCNSSLSIICGKGAKLQFYNPQKSTSLL